MCVCVFIVWWINNRGKVQGISGVGLTLVMTGALPPLANAGLRAVGWRVTYYIIGGVLATIYIPVIFFFLLDSPEKHGMLPDAKWPMADIDNSESKDLEREGMFLLDDDESNGDNNDDYNDEKDGSFAAASHKKFTTTTTKTTTGRHDILQSQGQTAQPELEGVSRGEALRTLSYVTILLF